MKNKIYLWSKTEIANAVGVDVEVLPSLISEETKKRAGWVSGRQKFKPDVALFIFSDINPLWSKPYILELMGYNQKECT